ncbi:phytanoyl-CoA dioxygenase family protein [Mycobacterium sp. CBMA293]|uniref:phytanoyl-CoA dioxygenase family protein n=1 Tax=unclassified Mycolicibacterium TaxID=2636767 RepID=UPI0012DF6C23|nr:MULTISPECIES: phytanoyl-CoA dioxygenase family protein [unclassified Mycolicibacterium]MUL45654.1 phytanoyl-CoA dioxygenase family protein [Mycolicibacterium sp. CBMA 360]MUL60324.1 phytanoyl-CoA dioxygenase family protein [Mycolicibacterium sp. CBMA 335]MUL71464.1 phytanoyl-CoA dioxygenase family protein [Mycolicibacterium sp. CBMA 311]MUL73111.1 phytanoyl-CoA dioxygenase family protein [Mycolicibacterium sp. CBMA 311]MUL95914.1 phytanoyl-CoA dioxygenase family protein [Mycolicibacterium s
MATDQVSTGLPWVDAIAASFPRRSFDDFHTGELAALNALHGALVVDDLAAAPPLAFQLTDGATYTWRATPAGVEAISGDADAATLVELDEATFSAFLSRLLSASGAVRTDRARLLRGTLDSWRRWEPAIQTLLTGTPIYTDAVRDVLVDRDGRPLDLHQAFTVDDDLAAMRHFFNVAGYLHIRGVYSAAEVAAWGAEVEKVRATSTPGDPFSWWSLNSGGAEIVTRINYLGRYSAVLQELCVEPRLTAYARLAGGDLRVCDDRLDGPMVFIKNSDVVKGDGDLGWHVDDGIGGHPVMCPLIQAGIQLDHANAVNGQLMVLAGSHRYTKHVIQWGQEGDLPMVKLDTEPGDLTLHYGDIMHSTPPPTGANAGRRVLYYKFAEEKTFGWIPAGCHYNDALFRADATGKVSSRAATH